VALGAQGDEILQAIISQTTSPVHVMNLQVIGRPTVLTTPSVSFEDLLT